MKALPSVHSRKGFKGLKALASHSAMLLFASLCVVFIWHDQKWWQYLLAPWIHVADMYSCRIIFIVCERESAWISAPSLPVTRPHFFSFLRDSAKWSKACKCDRIITYSFSPTPSWCLIKLQWPSCKPLESDEIWMKSAFFPPKFWGVVKWLHLHQTLFCFQMMSSFEAEKSTAQICSFIGLCFRERHKMWVSIFLYGIFEA